MRGGGDVAADAGTGAGGAPSAPTTRTSRGERTRARLLDAARSAFAAHGYTVARVEDVVANAGVSHGTFYTYFDNKAAVLDALIDATEAELLAVVQEPWEGPAGSQTIAAVIGRFVGLYAEQADVVRAWREAAIHDPAFDARLTQVRASFVQRVAEGLRPVLAPTVHDEQVAATALVAMVEGYATSGPVSADPSHNAEVVRTLTALWLGGLLRLSEDAAPV
jgi:AcrR family transcriptional regulator